MNIFGLASIFTVCTRLPVKGANAMIQVHSGNDVPYFVTVCVSYDCNIVKSHDIIIFPLINTQVYV